MIINWSNHDYISLFLSCYNYIFTNLGYIKDNSFELMKVFIRITKIQDKNYMKWKQKQLSTLELF